jgi:Cd2+/Zn2+-exporting ATPase
MHNLLYSVEKNFTHSIAKSITNYLKDKSNNVELNEITNLPGYGVSASYNGSKVLIGNEKLLENEDIKFSKIDTNYTVIYVSFDDEYLGYLTIEDTLKNDATKTINELLQNYELYVLSGDKNESVSNTCELLGITNYESELLPDEKFNSLVKISEKKTVMYVGDGINDAACLIKSDIGLAMNSMGSDIAINASDVVLMDDNLESINKAIKIAKKTKRIVIQNIVFSLLVKVAVMIIAILFSVPMSLAIIADVGVALIAIANALRIMYGKI